MINKDFLFWMFAFSICVSIQLFLGNNLGVISIIALSSAQLHDWLYDIKRRGKK